MRHRRSILLALSLLLISGEAFAGGGIVEFINYYKIILEKFGLDHHGTESWMPTLGGILVFFVITVFGLLYKKSVEGSQDVLPDGRFTLKGFVEMILDVPYGIAKDNCGEHFKSHVMILAGLFVYILFSNLSGLIPGFPPPTESMDTNLAVGIIVFIYYNVAGFKENGIGYLKHFAGPVAFIAPIFFVLELVSHMARPFSLSIRLMGNIFGDHLMLSVFTGLTYVVFPAALMFFGLLVAVIQSFVFTLLSGLYISMAVSHDH